MTDLSSFYQTKDTYDIYVWLAYAVSWIFLGGLTLSIIGAKITIKKKYDRLISDFDAGNPQS